MAGLLGVCLVCSPTISISAAEPSVNQRIELATGWNLVSVQIEPEGGLATVTAGLSNKLHSIWSYDAARRVWQTFQATNSSYPHSVQDLEPGRGYWIKMKDPATLSITGRVWSGEQTLFPGWNLIGFGGLAVKPNDNLTRPAVFRGLTARVPRIWAWEGGTARRFVGIDAQALPPIESLKTLEAGRGYWVYSLDHIHVAPAAVIALPADSDTEPLAAEQPYMGGDPQYFGSLVRAAGPEDAGGDLNGNGILDTPYTQNTLEFAAGVSQQLISILNTGLGAMNWSVESDVPWLDFDQRAGVTTTETDAIRVTVNSAGLNIGWYFDSFVIRAGNLERTIHVRMEVPTVAGDYRGFATTTRVNGKDIPLGKVDLNLSLFNETELPGETRFRGVINRDQALLFPKDVFMNGIFYQGLDFSLTTSFEMPPGDRNVPPYNTFAHDEADTVGAVDQIIITDRDHNRDGRLDNENIFPFSIRREVTLLGSRVTADRLEGTYIEAIKGPLPNEQPIYIEGIFELDRESLEPTRKSIYIGRTNQITAIGGSAGGISSLTNTVSIATDVNIEAVRLLVNYSFPNPAELEFILYHPSLTQSIRLGGIPSGSPVTLTNFNGQIGRGDWRLVVNWNPLSGERGFLNNWELRVEGLAFYSASGNVVTVNGGATNALEDANVSLAGSNIIPRAMTATDGSFTFPSLSENDYFLTVSKFGFGTVTRSFSINIGDTNLGAIVMTPLAITDAHIAAAPLIGQAPLHVTLAPMLPASQVATLGDNLEAIWDFGDGSPAVITNSAFVSHVYQRPGSFTPFVTVRGSLAQISLGFGARHITALAAIPDPLSNPPEFNLVGIAFMGSLASPVSNHNVLERSPVTVDGRPFVALYQESKRDSAAFDLDREPYSVEGAPLGAEDSDFFVQPGTPFRNLLALDPTGIYSTNVIAPYRMIATLGGFVFPPEDKARWRDNTPRVGAFVLQVGRIEE